MKKILTLIALISTFAFGAHATTRSIHLKVITNLQTGDTIVIDSVNASSNQYIFSHGFINQGPGVPALGDTLRFTTPYNSASYYYVLQSTDIPWATGDTLGYFLDTLGFKNGPATGNTQWCDSSWLKSGGTDTIVDPNTANAKICETVYILNKNGTTGIISTGLNKVSFTLYPNPTNDFVNFTYNFANSTNVKVRVIDLTGRTINTINYGKVNAGDQTYKIDVTNLPAGTYMLEFTTDENRGIAKFTKN